MKVANISRAKAIKENLKDFTFESKKSKKGYESIYAICSRVVADKFIEFVQTKDKDFKIIDLGCGDGTATDYMQKKGLDVLGIDINQKKLNKVTAPTICRDFISWMEDQKSDSIDNIFCHHAIEHCPKPKKVLQEIARILKPDGYCLLVAPYDDTLHDVHYVAFESANELVPPGLSIMYDDLLTVVGRKKKKVINVSYLVLSQKL